MAIVRRVWKFHPVMRLLILPESGKIWGKFPAAAFFEFGRKKKSCVDNVIFEFSNR